MSAQISSMSSKTASRTGISPPVSVGGGRYGQSRRWSMAPEEKFEALVDEFTGRPGITPPGATGGVVGAGVSVPRGRRAPPPRGGAGGGGPGGGGGGGGFWGFLPGGRGGGRPPGA